MSRLLCRHYAPAARQGTMTAGKLSMAGSCASIEQYTHGWRARVLNGTKPRKGQRGPPLECTKYCTEVAVRTLLTCLPFVWLAWTMVIGVAVGGCVEIERPYRLCTRLHRLAACCLLRCAVCERRS